MQDPLKHADWLSPRRVLMLGVATFLTSLVPIIFLIATSNGNFDLNGKVLGTDYSAFWSAGRFALEGQASDAYDITLQDEHLESLFGDPDTPLTAWLHPPTFFLVVTPLAAMSYLISLVCWISIGLVSLMAMMRHIDLRGKAVFLVLAFPPVLMNIPHGQTGMLISALFGGALLCLDKRPYVAGLLIGLMTFKPHLGPLIPFALLIGGHHKTLVSAVMTSLALILITSVWLGVDIWQDFLQSLVVSRGMILEAGGAGWFKLQSLYATLRVWGASVELAYLIHGIIACAIALIVFSIWSRPVHFTLKFAALIAGSGLISPYVYDYDLAMLAPALGWFILCALRSGFLTYEKSALVFVGVAPAFSRPMVEALQIPLGFLASLIFFGIITRRAWLSVNPPDPKSVAVGS